MRLKIPCARAGLHADDTAMRGQARPIELSGDPPYSALWEGSSATVNAVIEGEVLRCVGRTARWNEAAIGSLSLVCVLWKIPDQVVVSDAVVCHGSKAGVSPRRASHLAESWALLLMPRE